LFVLKQSNAKCPKQTAFKNFAVAYWSHREGDAEGQRVSPIIKGLFVYTERSTLD